MYDPNEDVQPEDKFGPCTQGDFYTLPKEVTVKFIGSEQDVPSLQQLLGKSYIGIDSEWRPQMTKFDFMRPALLQLSDQTNAYLIDLVALANSHNLDNILCEIFNHKESICIGFSFSSDLQVFQKHLPRMNFFKSFANFIDL